MDFKKIIGVPTGKVRIFAPFAVLLISLFGLLNHSDPEFIILSLFIGIVFISIGLYIRRHSNTHSLIHNSSFAPKNIQLGDDM